MLTLHHKGSFQQPPPFPFPLLQRAGRPASGGLPQAQAAVRRHGVWTAHGDVCTHTHCAGKLGLSRAGLRRSNIMQSAGGGAIMRAPSQVVWVPLEHPCGLRRPAHTHKSPPSSPNNNLAHSHPHPPSCACEMLPFHAHVPCVTKIPSQSFLHHRSLFSSGRGSALRGSLPSLFPPKRTVPHS